MRLAGFALDHHRAAALGYRHQLRGRLFLPSAAPRLRSGTAAHSFVRHGSTGLSSDCVAVPWNPMYGRDISRPYDEDHWNPVIALFEPCLCVRFCWALRSKTAHRGWEYHAAPNMDDHITRV